MLRRATDAVYCDAANRAEGVAVKRQNIALLLLLAVAFSIGIFVYVVIPQCAIHSCAGDGTPIRIVNEDVAPFRYRILQRILPALIIPAPNGNEPLFVSLLLHTLCFAAIYSGLYVWLKRWTDESRALLGVFLFVAFLPLAMHIYAPLIASILEVALVVWGLVLLGWMQDKFAQ